MIGWILFGGFALLIFRLLAIFIIPPGGDEVIHLYIAEDIATLSRFPVYFYQQEMMGTLESYVIAPFFRLFGFSFWGGRLYYSLFYLSFMALYLGVVRRLFNRELTTYLFILLSVLPFPALFFTTVVGWNEILAFAALSLVLVLKIANQRGKGSGSSWMLGFLSGLAFWCNPLFVIWLAPIGISLIWLIPMSWKRKLPLWFVFGFLVGLFPVWIHGFQTGTSMNLGSYVTSGLTKVEDLPLVFYLFFARLKYFLTTFSFGPVSPLVDGLTRWLTLIPFSLFLGSFGALLFHVVRSGSVQSVKEKVFYSFTILPPFALLILYCSRGAVFSQTEGLRFFLQLLPAYVFAVSWWISGLRSPYWKKGILGLLGAILLLGFLYSGKEMFQRTSNFREVIRFLERKNLHFGIADIGIAYSLNALSQNRILATPVPYRAPP